MVTRERMVEPGTLYLVATPIGNLEDITLRAIRVLTQVDTIACEDTRQTQKLLSHFNIGTKTVSYHDHNELTRSAELVVAMEQGASVALVSDAGTPGISDPGYRLVTLAVRHKIPVVPVPGAAAFLAALMASGLATDSFRFSGFLPSKIGQRREVLAGLIGSSQTEFFYEAPHRILDALEDVAAVLGAERPVVLAREVTKLHEEFLRGSAGEVLATLRERVSLSGGAVRGELTLLVGKADESTAVVLHKSVAKRLAELQAEEGLDEKTALKKLAKERGVSKSAAYRELQRGKK